MLAPLDMGAFLGIVPVVITRTIEDISITVDTFLLFEKRFTINIAIVDRGREHTFLVGDAVRFELHFLGKSTQYEPFVNPVQQIGSGQNWHVEALFDTKLLMEDEVSLRISELTFLRFGKKGTLPLLLNEDKNLWLFPVPLMGRFVEHKYI